MNKFVKYTGIAIFAAALAADAAAAQTGSCEGAAAKLSLGKTFNGELVAYYDEDDGTSDDDSPVYYCKLTVSRGDSATIVMKSEYTTFSVYEEDREYGEDVSFPPGWEEASDPYEAKETRYILRSEDWEEDAPRSVTYYVCVEGKYGDVETGQKFSLDVLSGEHEAPIHKGVDEDTAELVTPKEKFVASPGNMTEAYTSGYYFRSNLTAGRKYYFGTYDSTTNRTDLVIYGTDDSSVTPMMTPVSEKIDGTEIANATHAAYCVIPTNTMAYYIFVSNDSTNGNTSVTLWHKAIPSRTPKDHKPLDLGTPGEEAVSADIAPAYRNNPATNYFDSVIDDALVSAKFVKDAHYLFRVDNLSADPGNLVMELYDEKGNVLLSSRKGFLGDPAIGPMFVCKATAAGTFYVGVCQDTADSKGDETPVAGLTGRISVSTVTADAYLDGYDSAEDPNADVTPVEPAIGEHGAAPETADAAGQVHNFGLTDWTDSFSFPVRKGITYSFSVTPRTETVAGTEVSGAGFAYAGTVYTLNGKTKTVVKKVQDLSTTPLAFKASSTATNYLEITKDGQGIPAVYSLHSMMSAPNGLGQLTVNIHGPGENEKPRWYLSDEPTLTYTSGTTLLLPADVFTVRCSPVTGWSTAEDVSVDVVRDVTTTVEAYYNDTADPLDNNPDKTARDPRTRRNYAPTTLKPSAKGVTVAGRRLWNVDPADWFTFESTAGTFYKFSLSGVEGDPEVRVYGPDNWTNECDYVIATNAAEAVQIAAQVKGKYYVKVAHADAEAPGDGRYSLTVASAVPGLVKVAKADVSVKDSVGYVDISVSRTGKDGVVRAKYHTEGAQTDRNDAYYYPTDGIVTWAANDNKAKTIRVKLVPFAGWSTNKVLNVVFEPIPESDPTFDPINEYPAVFAKDTKGVVLDRTKITITASAKKAPGTIQVADSSTPKKPVYTVKAGETIKIPFVRVAGADGIVGVKVETAKGSANKSGETDFVPVNVTNIWHDGETAAQVVSIATKKVEGDYTATKAFKLKLTALTSAKADPVQYDKPALAATKIDVTIVNEKYAATMASYAKTVTAATDGYTLKESKKDEWVILGDGSFYAPKTGGLTFDFKTAGTFTYKVNGETKTFVATAKNKTLKITGATTFEIVGYELDGEAITLRQGLKHAEYEGLCSWKGAP